MKHKTFITAIILSIFSLVSCSKSQSTVNEAPIVSEQNNKITVEIRFSTYTTGNKAIEDVDLILVGYDGEVIDTLKTDSNGEVSKRITVLLDNRYSNTVKDELVPRGTITIIAFKDGYRESVIFEAGVSEATPTQQILMHPLIEGERNEPEIYLGNNHHLEILSLVNKYGKSIGKEAHY